MTIAQQNQQAALVGRLAPSPSGRMHLGNVFSCLMAWLDVRSQGGRLLLRIENLDPRTQQREVAFTLMDDLHWLGLEWDGAPVWQTERLDLYAEALAQLEAQGLLYPCFCSRADLHAATAPHVHDGTYVYGGTCRNLSAPEVAARSAEHPYALRVRVPEAHDSAGTIHFDDDVYGPQSSVLAYDCGDFVVRRSDGVFAYQLAVVVDDLEMRVNRVVRGHDLLGSVARQAWLTQLFGGQIPGYAHVPLLVAGDGRRLSKRDRDLDVGVLRERGISPTQIISALAWELGLAEKGEFVSLDELVMRFSWEQVHKQRSDIVVDDGLLVNLAHPLL